MSDSRSDRSRDPSHGAGLFRDAAEYARSQAVPPHGLPTLTELQEKFPEYELEGLIGRGGMGAVYRARDPKLQRYIAIKVLPPHLGADPSFEERFAREARALARLQHPHILTVHDYGERDGLPYLITEFVDGVDLRKLIATERISASEALRIVPQICDALQVAHEHGVVHRDVKPENILIDTRGHVRVADFGLAKMLGTDSGPGLTATDQALGTAHYAAPETFRGQPVDHRADIFSLGVLLYELLTGQLPVGHFRPPSERAGTEPRLDEIVSRALRDEPAERYQSVADVRRDLDTPPKAEPKPEPRRARQHAAGGGEPRHFGSDQTRSRNSWQWVLYVILFAPLIVMSLIMLAGFISSVFDPIVEVGGSEVGDARAQKFAVGTFAFGFFGLLWLVLVIQGFRRLGRLRRGEIDGSVSLIVLRAWVQILLPINFAILTLLPELQDRDSQTIFEASVAAFLVVIDIVLIAWQTSSVRADLVRRAG